MSHSARNRVARCVGHSAVAATLAAIAATTVPLVVPGCGQYVLVPRNQRDELDGQRAEDQVEQSDQIELRRGVLSDEGVFLIYDAAMPVGAPRSQPGYLAWWTEIGANEAHVYGRLVLTGADVGQALLDLERDLSVDIDALAAEDPFLSEAVDEALLVPPDSATFWRLATYGLAAELMGFPVDPDDPNSVTPVHTRGDDCCPLESVKAVLRLKAPEAVDHPYKVVTIAMALCGCGGSCTVACNDGNPCTLDWCDHAVCYHDPRDGAICADDGNSCTKHVCNGTVCERIIIGGDCEDGGEPCTDDVCVLDECTHPPIGGAVYPDDGDPCTLDICDDEGECTHPPTSGPECDGDGNPCTKDVCVNGACKHQLADPEDYCDDGTPCTSDTCVCGVGCVNSPICDDGDPCTVDQCDPDTLACSTQGPWWFQPDTCSEVGCLVSTSAPSWAPANNDDDNGNEQADWEETADGEDDLEVMTLSTTGCPPSSQCVNWPDGHWNFIRLSDIPFGDPSIRIYLNDDKTEPLTEMMNRPWPTPSEVYIEGLAPTSACPTPAQFYSDGIENCQCFSWTSPITIVAVQRLEWQVHAASSNPAAGCGGTGGPNAGLDSCPNNAGRQIVTHQPLAMPEMHVGRC